MKYIKTDFNIPYYNMAFENYIMTNDKFDDDYFFFYIHVPSIIVGKHQNTIEEIEKNSYNVVIDYKEKLNNRISEILDNPSLIDENRLDQEVAIYADKSSITEEIVRFNSHITQLKNTVVKDDSVGRKMDFLIQEMNREINTMGSKSSDINITNLVVEVKSELEKIREQIQNIE